MHRAVNSDLNGLLGKIATFSIYYILRRLLVCKFDFLSPAAESREYAAVERNDRPGVKLIHLMQISCVFASQSERIELFNKLPT